MKKLFAVTLFIFSTGGLSTYFIRQQHFAQGIINKCVVLLVRALAILGTSGSAMVSQFSSSSVLRESLLQKNADSSNSGETVDNVFFDESRFCHHIF